MPKKRYTPEEIIQHLRTVELDTAKAWPCSTPAGSSASLSKDAGAVFERGAVQYTQGSTGHDGPLENSLQHGPSA
jgi:hypothetical protein